MTKAIRCTQSLTQVIRAVALARTFGQTVFIECNPRHSDITQATSYTKFSTCFHPRKADETIDLDVGEIPEAPLLGIFDRLWGFDPKRYRIDKRPMFATNDDVSPVRYRELCKMLGADNIYIMTQDQNKLGDGIHVSCFRLRDLPGLLAFPSKLATNLPAVKLVAEAIDRKLEDIS